MGTGRGQAGAGPAAEPLSGLSQVGMWEPGSAEGTREHGQWKVTAVSTGPLGGQGRVGGACHQTMNGVGGWGLLRTLTCVGYLGRPPVAMTMRSAESRV